RIYLAHHALYCMTLTISYAHPLFYYTRPHRPPPQSTLFPYTTLFRSSTSIGNNKTWLDQADRVIIEVNSWMNPALLGMHDVYYGTRLPPHRKPIRSEERRVGKECRYRWWLSG